MFEKVLVKPNNFLKYRQPIIDFIDLLLYYDEVHIIIDPINFTGFYRALNEDIVEELIKSKRVFLHPTDSQIGCNCTNDGYYGITFISHGWNDIHHLLYEFHNRLILDDKAKSKQFADRFSSFIEPLNYSNNLGTGIYKNLLDSDYLTKALRIYLQQNYPSYYVGDNIKIESELSNISLFPNAFKVKHNVNDYLFSAFSNNTKTSNFIVYPFILNVADAIIASYLASQYSTEISTTYEKGEYMKLKFENLIQRSGQSRDNLNSFQKHIMHHCPSIGEAYIENNIDSKELIRILNNAEKFRSWLTRLPNDTSLISEYTNDINKKVISENVWFKLTRTIAYSIVSTFGITGSIISTSISILDAILADRIASGWKPNLFIDDLKNKLNTKI